MNRNSPIVWGKIAQVDVIWEYHKPIHILKWRRLTAWELKITRSKDQQCIKQRVGAHFPKLFFFFLTYLVHRQLHQRTCRWASMIMWYSYILPFILEHQMYLYDHIWCYISEKYFSPQIEFHVDLFFFCTLLYLCLWTVKYKLNHVFTSWHSMTTETFNIVLVGPKWSSFNELSYQK